MSDVEGVVGARANRAWDGRRGRRRPGARRAHVAISVTRLALAGAASVHVHHGELVACTEGNVVLGTVFFIS